MPTLAEIAQTPYTVFDRIHAAAQAPAVVAIDPGFAVWLEDHKPVIIRTIEQTAQRLDREARAHWRQLMLAVQEALKEHQAKWDEPTGMGYISPAAAKDILYRLSGEYQAPGARTVAPRDFDDLPTSLQWLLQSAFADPQLDRSTADYFTANDQAQIKRLAGMLYAVIRKDEPATIKYTTASAEYDYPRDTQELETFTGGDPPRVWRKVAIYGRGVGPQINRWYSGNAAIQDEDPRLLWARMDADRERIRKDRAYAASLKGQMEAVASLTEFDRRRATGEWDRLHHEDVSAARRKVIEREEQARQEQTFQEELEWLREHVPEGSTVVEYSISRAGAGYGRPVEIHKHDVLGVYTNVRHPTSRHHMSMAATYYPAKGKPRPASLSLFDLHGPRESRLFEVYTGPIPPAVLAKSHGPDYVKPLSTSQGTVYWLAGRYGGNGTMVHADGRTISVNQKLYAEARYGTPAERLKAAQVPDPDGVHFWLTDGHALYRNDVLPKDWPSLDNVKTDMDWKTIGEFIHDVAETAQIPYAFKGETKHSNGTAVAVWEPVDKGKGRRDTIWTQTKLAGPLRKAATVWARGLALHPLLGRNAAGEVVALVMPLRKD